MERDEKEKPDSLVLSRHVEIVLPSDEEVSLLGKSCGLSWKEIRYNIAAYNIKSGHPMQGERFITDHIFGRCLGERSDGKTFFATAIVPWIWEEGYDWRKIARERLETFLDPQCQCDARTEEAKVCDYHKELMWAWDSDDRNGLEETKREALGMPPGKEGGGVYATSKELHKDYPWCRELPNVDGYGFRYCCTICGFEQEERHAYGNPSYRNLFVSKHSHCGFGDASRYAPQNPEDVKTTVDKLKELNDRFLNPITRSPGHKSGCVCHRCRIADENQKTSITVQDLDSMKKKYPLLSTSMGSWFHPPTGFCSNCRRQYYKGEDGVLYHLDLFRTCDLTGRTVAEA